MAARLGFGWCLLIMVAMLVCTAGAQDDGCLGLYYTGDLFDRFGATALCAQVGCPCDCSPTRTFLAGEGVWFQALDLWNIRRTHGAFTTRPTNAVGSVCDPQNFGSGVFEVQAFGASGGLLDGVTSPPVAVTVFSCRPGVGIAAGGALMLDTCRPRPCGPRPPDVLTDSIPTQPLGYGCMEYSCRRATFGLFYDVCRPSIVPKRPVAGTTAEGLKLKPIEFCFDVPLPHSGNEQLLFLDPCNPDGAVKIRVTNFKSATLPVFAHINLLPPWWYIRFEGLKLMGYCEYTVGDGPPQTKHFEAMLGVNYWVLSSPPYFKCRDASFSIRVWEYPSTTLYQAGGKIQDGGWQIF
ncbi:MAG: hypothetical protein KBC96_09515 [Armatimonadetes bacterium]|nr:hypothetical protein [Armatimonadota bacterium]